MKSDENRLSPIEVMRKLLIKTALSAYHQYQYDQSSIFHKIYIKIKKIFKRTKMFFIKNYFRKDTMLNWFRCMVKRDQFKNDAKLANFGEEVT